MTPADLNKMFMDGCYQGNALAECRAKARTNVVGELNQELKEQNLIGYWTIPEYEHWLSRAGARASVPFLWKWKEIRAALDQAAQLIRPEETLGDLWIPASWI